MGRLMKKENLYEQGKSGEGEVAEKSGIAWGKFFRIFKYRVPLWIIAPIVVLYFGWVGVQNITSTSPTNLKPAITDAPAANISITMCRTTVREIGLDVSGEEVRLEKRFESVENVEDANVSINQKDCDEK